MIIVEYKFLDGTFFRLLDSVFSWSDVHELSSLHGKVVSIRSYSYGA